MRARRLRAKLGVRLADDRAARRVGHDLSGSRRHGLERATTIPRRHRADHRRNIFDASQIAQVDDPRLIDRERHGPIRSEQRWIMSAPCAVSSSSTACEVATTRTSRMGLPFASNDRLPAPDGASLPERSARSATLDHWRWPVPVPCCQGATPVWPGASGATRSWTCSVGAVDRPAPRTRAVRLPARSTAMGLARAQRQARQAAIWKRLTLHASNGPLHLSGRSPVETSRCAPGFAVVGYQLGSI